MFKVEDKIFGMLCGVSACPFVHHHHHRKACIEPMDHFAFKRLQPVESTVLNPSQSDHFKKSVLEGIDYIGRYIYNVYHIYIVYIQPMNSKVFDHGLEQIVSRYMELDEEKSQIDRI